MSTVALIGPDGAGKTSVARALLASSPLPFKYLYMGMSVESSNVALPTSRLAHRVKVAQHRRSLRKSGMSVPDEVHLHGIEHRMDRRGKLGALARLIRRISEELYRQVVSWRYQRRGHVVLYDRHFLFDSYPRPSDRSAKRRVTDRIHNWFLYRVYPRPTLVVFLDASPEVLYARKQEVPLEYLRSYREALLEKREYAPAWVTVDVSRPLDEVVPTVSDAIIEYLSEMPSD